MKSQDNSHSTGPAARIRRKILASRGCDQCYTIVARGSVAAVALYGRKRVACYATTESDAMAKLEARLKE